MEHWDVYDAHRCKKGYQVPKGTVMKEGEYHLVVHVCVFNKNGEMLIQKRKETKANWPGLWDFSSGGAAMAGENSNTAAQRELREELAINYSLADARPVLTMHFEDGFDDYYTIQIEDDLVGQIQFAEAEIDEIMWASYDQIIELIDDGKFGIIKSFVSVIFDMHKQRGNHN